MSKGLNELGVAWRVHRIASSLRDKQGSGHGVRMTALAAEFGQV